MRYPLYRSESRMLVRAAFHAGTKELTRPMKTATPSAIRAVTHVIDSPWSWPTIPSPASRIFHDGQDIGPLERLERVAGTVLNTAPFNATGHPALSLPVGFVPAPEKSAVRLPAALQIVGAQYGDLSCLKIAAAWERSVDWQARQFGA